MSEGEAWGQLVSLTDIDTDPIPLTSDRFTIGRALDCDLCLSENKLVSGHHCNIQRDESGKVILCDSSTNGTLLNLTYKVTKGKHKELEHGDEFYIVYKKNNEEANVGYIYQDTAKLREEEGTQEYSPPDLLDATLEDSGVNYISPEKPGGKRKSEDESNEEIPLKKQKTQPESSAGDSKTKQGADKSNITSQSKQEGGDKKSSIHEDKKAGEGGDKKSSIHDDKKAEEESKCTVNDSEGSESKSRTKDGEKAAIESKEKEKEGGDCKSVSNDNERDDIEENLQCIICQEIMHDCIRYVMPLNITPLSFQYGGQPKLLQYKNPGSEVEEQCPKVACKDANQAAFWVLSGSALLYTPVTPEIWDLYCLYEADYPLYIAFSNLPPSLQPCLHSFCSGCYSDWMARSNECPSCRLKVQRINKNHIVNNLIEAYLKEHPGKRRPEEDIKELDAKNKITKDMLYPKRKHGDCTDSSDYSDTSEEEDNTSTTTPPFPVPVMRPVAPAFVPAPAPAPTLFGFGTPVFGVHRPPKTVCRQCPEYKDPLDGTGIIGGIKTAWPSTSGEGTKLPYKEDPKDMPDPFTHNCGPLQNHVLCQCCLQPMPDLRTLQTANPDLYRPQQCRLCYRAYCHAYWGCRKADCLGCLNKLKDMNFGRKALMGLILNNQHESEIFKDYIDAHGMSVKDVLQECCKRLEAGHFTITAQMTHTANSNTPVCYACGLNIFRELAFQYRKTLKKEDFPEKVRNRPDCYWGYKCRTQKNKPHHAVNFNHICEQTRQY